MAFTTRSIRDINFSQAQTPNNIGPGSYKVLDAIDPTSHLRLTCTPFSSTQKREIIYTPKENEQTPGPGSYHKPEKIGKRKASFNAFKSKTRRFDPIGEQTRHSCSVPGPGSYNIANSDSWSKVQLSPKRDNSEQQKQQQQKQIMWLKASSAPSIPAVRQSHGYEEGPNGELIRQKAPYQGYHGTKESSAGPGEYETVRQSMNNPKDFSSAFKSHTKRDVFGTAAKKSLPGPGDYDVLHSEQILLPQRKSVKSETSVFLSNSNRTTFAAPKEITPGPGEYGYHSSFATEKVPEKMQNFGSNSVRPFDNPDTTPNRLQVPGPGYYNPSPHHTDTFSQSRKPFLSTSERFAQQSNEIPGPGTYDKEMKKASFTSDVEAKIKIGSYGVFGSTSRRFNLPKPKAPGPGQYHPEIAERHGAIKKKDPRSSIFSSRTKRDAIPIPQDKLEGPSVGQYEIKSEWVKQKSPQRSQNQDVFLSRSQRFQDDPSRLIAPGPGTYDHDTYLVATKPKSFATTSSILPKQLRFVSTNREHEELPGPGAYHQAPELVKKSFNVTI